MLRPVLACLLAALSLMGSAAFAAGDPPARLKNSLGMELVRIGPGSFTMGTADGGDWDERPAHPVAVTRPFYVAATEVTNAQYEQFDPQHKKLRGKLGFSKADDEAVVFVNWHEAVDFCDWISRKEGRPYRLPTEAEWEFACRAGTATAYHTGEKLPTEFHKNVRVSWYPSDSRSKEGEAVPLTVAKTPANPWGLFDMHGNVEEWCLDWYGPYAEGRQADPLGRERGDFRVTRGGSHSTTLEYLRSANRAGTLPEDKSWLIGFRVVQAELPAGKMLAPAPPPLNQRNVKEGVPQGLERGPDPASPFFLGPRQYVKVPPGSEGPLLSKHNHDPAIAECPNGDLLAIWYTCRTEQGRELGVAASRLRHGAEEWDEASPFWDAPDRNDHAPALWCDPGNGVLYHFNGLSAAATWGNLALVLRTSRDNGATWDHRLIAPEHGMRHQPVETVFRTKAGSILLPCDAVPGGQGGTAIHLGRDGKDWTDPGEGQPMPEFKAGATGVWIAGIHAAVVELSDGRLMALGRGNAIDGHMPMSLSGDGGRTWTYSASPFEPIGGGQRCVLLRLREGPVFFASFTKGMTLAETTGQERTVKGLFAALSPDDGKTWPVRRLITDGGPPREVDGGGNTGKFILGPDSSEPRGYLSVCQAADGVIHLIGSKQHYAMNLAWLKAAPPARQ